MTVHDTKLPKEFDDFARDEGFNPYATVVPSAAGLPLSSKLSPEDARAHSKEVFRAARKGLRGAIVIER